MKVSKTGASSKIQGFGYSTKASASFSQAAFALGGSGASITQTFTMPVSNITANAASLTRLRLNGIGYASVEGSWFQIFGQWQCQYGTGKPAVTIAIQRVQNALLIKVTYKNTAVSGLTVPAHTLEIVTYFYTAPW